MFANNYNRSRQLFRFDITNNTSGNTKITNILINIKQKQMHRLAIDLRNRPNNIINNSKLKQPRAEKKPLLKLTS